MRDFIAQAPWIGKPIEWRDEYLHEEGRRVMLGFAKSLCLIFLSHEPFAESVRVCTGGLFVVGDGVAGKRLRAGEVVLEEG
jgi:hypothetical protein